MSSKQNPSSDLGCVSSLLGMKGYNLWTAFYCVNIREQLYYNNEHRQVVTSFQFVKIFAKPPGLEPRPAGPSQIFSLVLWLLNH